MQQHNREWRTNLNLNVNTDDWIAIFGNLTKFGLGAVSILFDVVFMAQHYVIYKDADLDLSATLTESNANDSVGSIIVYDPNCREKYLAKLRSK